MRCLMYVLFIMLLTLINSSGFAATYPYRDFYPEVKIIGLAELKSGVDSGRVITVDVRSPVEFDAIHISDALNLPYTEAKFTQELKRLAGENPGKKIVAYCNGVTCIKSYKAAEDALYAGLQNVYTFDGGIKAWAEEYPPQTILNGHPISNPGILHEADILFVRACLEYEHFRNGAANPNAVVIDIRDPIQRKAPLPGLENALQIPLDNLVQDVIMKRHMLDKDLYIFDQVGKQVNWLMFHLEKYGYANYHFLDGGATAVLKTQEYR